MQAQSNQDNQAHNFDPVILREYDVRGQVEINLSEQDAYVLGQSFGTHIRRDGGNSVCVGYDGRTTSPALSSRLIEGLRSVGINVISVGLGPTPMLYFAAKHLGTDGGIMVTGSHNPPDYNGFKMAVKSGPFYGDMIQKLGQIAAAGDFETGAGSLEEKDIKAAYIERILQDLVPSSARPLKIAWDNGNGAAGEVLRMLADKLPGEHILLFDDIDGTFPNHHPDPTVDKNLIDLKKAVADHGCDLGIGFDGDADRIGVIDEQGNILRCDILMTIYAREVLQSHPGAAIIGDVKCSQVMFDEIDRMGGQGVMWKTGHSLVKSKMSELNSPLAGELSGHIFFADKYYGYDDALYCAIRLINALNIAEAPLSSLTADLPKLHSTPEVRFEVEEEKKFDIVPQIMEMLRPKASETFQINDIDGIRVSTPDGWWLLRPSNTQSVLVARAEASSAEGLERLKNQAIGAVKEIGYDLVFDQKNI